MDSLGNKGLAAYLMRWALRLARACRSDRRAENCGRARETRPFRRGTLARMTDVTRIPSAIEQGDPHAAEQLLPLVYEELCKLAAQKLALDSDSRLCDVSKFVG